MHFFNYRNDPIEDEIQKEITITTAVVEMVKTATKVASGINSNINITEEEITTVTTTVAKGMKTEPVIIERKNLINTEKQQKLVEKIMTKIEFMTNIKTVTASIKNLGRKSISLPESTKTTTGILIIGPVTINPRMNDSDEKLETKIILIMIAKTVLIVVEQPTIITVVGEKRTT